MFSSFISTAKYDNQVHTLRLPPVDNMMALETYLHLLMDDLGCCSNFVSTTADVVNHQCNSDFSVPQTNTEKSFKRRGGTTQFLTPNVYEML